MLKLAYLRRVEAHAIAASVVAEAMAQQWRNRKYNLGVRCGRTAAYWHLDKRAITAGHAAIYAKHYAMRRTALRADAWQNWSLGAPAQ